MEASRESWSNQLGSLMIDSLGAPCILQKYTLEIERWEAIFGPDSAPWRRHRFLRRAALFQLAFVQTLRHVGKKRRVHTTLTYVFDMSNEHFDFWSPTASRASKAVRSGKGAYSLLSRRARHLFHSTVSPLVGDGPRRRGVCTRRTRVVVQRVSVSTRAWSRAECAYRSQRSLRRADFSSNSSILRGLRTN